jgi:hypothetical protein
MKKRNVLLIFIFLGIMIIPFGACTKSSKYLSLGQYISVSIHTKYGDVVAVKWSTSPPFKTVVGWEYQDGNGVLSTGYTGGDKTLTNQDKGGSGTLIVSIANIDPFNSGTLTYNIYKESSGGGGIPSYSPIIIIGLIGICSVGLIYCIKKKLHT